MSVDYHSPTQNTMLTPLTLFLLGASPIPGVAAEPLPIVIPLETATAVESYEDLIKAYSAAKNARRAEIKAAKTAKERKELRAMRPASQFLARFEAVGEAGDVRGFLWMLTESRKLGIKKSDRITHKLDIYGRIVMAPAGSKEFVSALRMIGEDDKLDATQRVNLLKRVMGREDVLGKGQCTAQLLAGSLLFKSEVGSDMAMGKQILEELVANEKCSGFAGAAEQALSGISIEVGGMAPDFQGTTIDGETFNLYDYRGKVVLVDFFGFW